MELRGHLTWNYGDRITATPYLIDPIRDDDFSEQLSKVSAEAPACAKPELRFGEGRLAKVDGVPLTLTRSPTVVSIEAAWPERCRAGFRGAIGPAPLITGTKLRRHLNLFDPIRDDHFAEQLSKVSPELK